jgi:rubrerythrin
VISQSLSDLREAMEHTLSLIEGQMREERAGYERQIDDLRNEFKQSLATSLAHVKGERDEARRHVDTLTGELRALRAQLAVPLPRPVYGSWDCKQCGETFERETKGQKTCKSCKRAQSQRNAARLLQARRPGQ